jgi:hypothetical protein
MTDDRRVEYMPLATIEAAPRNAKRHATTLIRSSISRFGVGELPLLDERTGRLVAGHGRLDDIAARKGAGEEPPDGVRIGPDGSWLVPVIRGWRSRSDDEAEAYLIASNQLTVRGGWDDDELGEMLASLADADPDLLDVTGFTAEDLAALLDADTGGDSGIGDGEGGGAGPNLAEKFLLPPFDVLDSRQGWWRERKKRWLSVGFRSEVGRQDRLVYNSPTANPDFYEAKRAAEERLGRTLDTAEFLEKYYVQPDSAAAAGTSVFDPVLCELAYRWFCPAGGTVLDPFAGGSVRGLVAAILGRQYLGNDLRADQVAENREQAEALLDKGTIDRVPVWLAGDSADWVYTLDADSADLIFTCPPYYDLETYSDDPADLSTLDYEAFDAKYAAIIRGAAAALRPDRFAVIVVGDARDSRGALHDLRGSTVRAAAAAGLAYSSGAVLINMVGSAAMRAARQFTATRTLTRLHQDVLIFTKGDRGRAAKACGDVEVYVPEALEDDDDATADAD